MTNQLYFKISLTIVFAIVMSILSIPQIIKWVKRNNLLDNPNERSEHKNPIPTLGGIGIFIGFIPVAIIAGIQIPNAVMLLLALLIIFFTGVVDDIKELSPSKKMIGQFLAALIISAAGIRLKSLYGLFGVEEIPIFMQYFLTTFLIVAITNAFNLIDGIDGLAGGIGVINSVLLGILFIASNQVNFALIAFALSGALLGFLYFNFNPAKIFMGDSGSLSVGFILSVLGIRLLESNVVFGDLALQASTICLLVVGIIFLPVFDFIRVALYRISKKQSPMKADRNHIHHLLIKTGFDHKKASIILYINNLILIGAALFLRNLVIEASIIILFIIGYFSIELLSLKKIWIIKGTLQNIKNNRAKLLKQNHFLKRQWNEESVV